MAGIDPSSDSVENLKKDGMDGYLGSIYDTPSEELTGSQDVVLLFDVLEHLLLLQKAILNLAKYIKEDGYLLIQVPNYAYLKHDDTPLPNQFNQEHINYFSIVSLDYLMNQCGFHRCEENGKLKSTEDYAEEFEITALYRRESQEKDSLTSETGARADTITEPAIRDYLSRNESNEKRINHLIEKANSDSVYIFGTGAYTMWLLENTILREKNIIGFVDNNVLKQGTTFEGKPIIGPKDITDNKIPILIASMLFGYVIERQIKEELQLKNPVIKI